MTDFYYNTINKNFERENVKIYYESSIRASRIWMKTVYSGGLKSNPADILTKGKGVSSALKQLLDTNSIKL